MNNNKINFENPPVVEVVLDAQFRELKNFLSKDFATVYDVFKDDFNSHKEMPPLQEIADNFEHNQIQLQFISASAPDLRRQWFISEDKSQLLQFQTNRFVANWRNESGKPYIRFENIKQNYENNFHKLQNLLGSVEVIQAEVTYINHIKVDVNLSFDEMFEKVFTSFKMIKFDDLESEGMRWSDRYLYDNGRIKGRLTVTTEAYTKLPEKERMVALRLSFKGRSSNDELSDFFNTGNSLITKMFCDITSDEMHKIWGRK